jgi:hypothetical protein
MPRPPHNRTETPVSPLTVTVEVDRDSLVRLRPAAARRATTPARLIGDLLQIIATDGLVDAVMDD